MALPDIFKFLLYFVKLCSFRIGILLNLSILEAILQGAFAAYLAKFSLNLYKILPFLRLFFDFF